MTQSERVDRRNVILIDAGVQSVRVRIESETGERVREKEIPSNAGLERALKALELPEEMPLYITGRLRRTVRRHLGRGELILPSAALWAAARELREGERSLAVLEISASGYLGIGIGADGELYRDTLVVNPSCGAGSGVNLDRVLQKLAIAREEVDALLEEYLGASRKEAREEIPVRADRCGVFASSATISDKNQGIPLSYALAVTLKSEVLKACKKLEGSFETLWLTGGIFRWRFARECAEDYFLGRGSHRVRWDGSSLPLLGLRRLHDTIGAGRFAQADIRVLSAPRLAEYPSLRRLREEMEARSLYLRLPGGAPADPDPEVLRCSAVMLGLDVGSTMAKLIVSDHTGERILYKGSYSNAGDTIDTIKEIFRDLERRGIGELEICRIGLTGSARYQVRTALINVYPALADRVMVLVENYAHARGSISEAREHLQRLRRAGMEVNGEFCLLVDIGGEDTKISSISLERGDLYDNAMNVKCSAGTGSLMDTLTSLFYLDDIGEACSLAFGAEKGYAINATCAVFLMESARKLQAEGYGTDEILVSANWAIVENMARTLWSQIELPPRTVTLLHGQTMLSDPLPVAVAHRLQSYLGAESYCIVPPDPGHRACIGLIKTMAEEGVESTVRITLRDFIAKEYTRKIIQCQGAACGDASARCNRARLTSRTEEGKRFGFSLGGCTAINELQANRAPRAKGSKDTYKRIWEFIDGRLPKSDDPNRLVIPRSFAVSEYAAFFAELFAPLGIPVHVDTVRESDVLEAQPHFHIDTCAPHIGAVGQFLRLASEPHGVILAPQIKFLPVGKGGSLGRTCTINQGGVAVARQIALGRCPDASIHLFYLDLRPEDPGMIARKLHPRLREVYRRYGTDPAFDEFEELVRRALAAHASLRSAAGDLAAELGMQALEEGRDVALVLGREYILTPGIYDSHVGRLLRDKNMAAVPGYLLDAELDPAFRHLYWRNPHMIATLAEAATRRRLHRVIRHPRLRELFERMEKGTQRLVPVVQVSTFLCGPDSVTNPLVSEITRERPYLFIQSDSIIKELAHLENRMNTYVRQLESDLHGAMRRAEREEGFRVELLERFVNREPLDPRKDAIYFPTLSDNRVLTSVIRAAGFVCVDLYHEGYDLQEAIKRGRSMAGDAVCAPLAAVYGDVMAAMEDFRRRRREDPAFAGIERLLIFNNKGLGPCRQGQYVETHKLFLNRREQEGEGTETLVQFLVGREHRGFDIGIPRWAYLWGIKSAVLQGVLHQLYADGAVQCRDFGEFRRFEEAYRELKGWVHDYLEHRIAPSGPRRKIGRLLGRAEGLLGYRLYGLGRGEIEKRLEGFARRWCANPPEGDPVRIHIDGEVYMRIAQYEEILRTLLGTLGFRQFRLTHSPVWSFLDYKIAGMQMRAREAVEESGAELRIVRDPSERRRLRAYRRKKRLRLAGLRGMEYLLRERFARPLYRAAGLEMPAPMREVLELAAEVVPTRRPGGELVPYIGEAVLKLREGYDLVLNVAPEGCMVSSMGEAITPGIHAAAPGCRGKIQPLFSQQGDIDAELIQTALLKTTGPERFYRRAEHSVQEES